MSVSAQEGQVVNDGDVNETLCLLYDSGNGFKIIATAFRNEKLWRGLSLDEGTQQKQSATRSLTL